MTRPATIKSFVDEFLATGKRIEYLRDIWYFMKGDIEHIKNPKHTTKKWDTYVNDIIGKYIFEEHYLKGDFQIYNRLGIITQGLSEDNYIGNTPMVIFTEKKTRTINVMANALLAAKYYSTGQVPHFECVNIAEYLINTAGENDTETVYIITLTDYDPAGKTIRKSLARRVQKILNAKKTGLHLKMVNVRYGTSYNDIITTYKNFTLSTNKKNHGCQKWIKAGMPTGVEFNNIDDRAAHLQRTIFKHISPEFVKRLSEIRIRTSIYNDLLRDDKIYQRVLRLKQKIEDKHRDTADNGDATFDENWTTPISWSSVKNMTTIEAV